MTTLAYISSPTSSRTTFTCKTIGSRLREKIAQSTGRLDGVVLNVFDNTINIKMDENELLVISLGKIPSPITINIPSEQDPKQNRCERHNSLSDFVFPGDHVRMVGQTGLGGGKSGNNIAEISLGNVFILVDKPDYFENNLQRFDENSLHSFSCYHENLFFVLAECASSTGKQGCLLNPDMITRGLLTEFLAQIYNGADIADITKPEGEARLYGALLGLCGRGPGFTPAGDDFISGFITMFNSMRSGLNIGRAIIPSPEFARLTTWVSFKLIEYNAMGLVDNQIQELINSAARGNVLLYIDKIRSLSKRGHTSGIDFVTGSTFALYMAADSTTKDHSRKRNLSKLVSTGA